MPLQFTDIDDAVAASQRNLGRGKFTDAASTYQDHVAFGKLMRKGGVQTVEEYGQQWNVLVKDSGAAQAVGLFATDDANVVDGIQQARVDMKHYTTNWSYDLREIDMNSMNLTQQIVSLVKARRAMAMIDLAQLMETDFWSTPSASDTVSFYGVPYYIVRSASAAGFNGTVQSGYTTVANINPTTWANWRNWTDRYTDVTYTDLIQRLEKACIKTMWKPPVDIKDYNTGNMVGLYTNYDVLEGMMKLMREQNDNLGRNLAWNSGNVMFRSSPVTWVPYLDGVSEDPVYGINWGDFKVLVLKSWFLRETEPQRAPNQHTVRTVHVDLSVQLKCTNRRKQFIVDKA